MPTSLIFVVLLGVWAAYFAQYWLRRRDHLATARSVEQFSEAMRVLERRPALPRADLSQPDPRSYAVHPARGARPQVIVKRAVAAEPVRAPAATTVPDAGRGGGPGLGASGRGTRRRVRPSRRVRGLVLLASLVAVLTVIPLVALAIVPLWALAPAAVTVVAAFFWVRSAVRAERALSRAGRRRPAQGRPSAVAASSEAPAASAHVAVRGAAGDAAGDAVPAASHTADAVAAEVSEADGDDVVVVAETGPGHSEELPEAVAEVMAPIVDEDDIPLTWDPVPVPRPTYTMKAKAERPEVAPAATTPEPVRHEGAGDGTAYDERRVAGA